MKIDIQHYTTYFEVYVDNVFIEYFNYADLKALGPECIRARLSIGLKLCHKRALLPIVLAEVLAQFPKSD
jgi:hypothetical protein